MEYPGLLGLLESMGASSSSQPLVGSRLEDAIASLVAAYVIPREGVKKELSTVLKFIEHTAINAPQAYTKAVSCGCIFKLIARLLVLEADLGSFAGSGIGNVLFRLSGLLGDARGLAAFNCFQDCLLLMEDLSCLLPMREGLDSVTLQDTYADVQAFQSLALCSHDPDQENPWCKNLARPSPGMSPSDVCSSLQLRLGDVDGILQLTTTLCTSLLLQHPEALSSALSTPAFQGLAQVFTYGSPQLKKDTLHLINACIQHSREEVLPKEEILDTLLILSELSSSGVQDFEVPVAACISSITANRSTGWTPVLSCRAPDIFSRLSDVCLKSATENLKDALIELAFSQALSSPQLQSASFGGLLQLLPSLKKASQGHLSKLLVHLATNTPEELKTSLHNADGPSFSVHIVQPFLHILSSTLPPRSGASVDTCSRTFEVKLGSLAVLSTIAIASNAASLISPVLGAVHLWASHLSQVGAGGEHASMVEGFLVAFSTVSSCGDAHLLEETEMMQSVPQLLDSIIVSDVVLPAQKVASLRQASFFEDDGILLLLKGAASTSSAVRAAAAEELCSAPWVGEASSARISAALRKLSDDPADDVKISIARGLRVLTCRHSNGKAASGSSNKLAACQTCGIVPPPSRSSKVPTEIQCHDVMGLVWELVRKFLSVEMTPGVIAAVFESIPFILTHTSKVSLEEYVDLNPLSEALVGAVKKHGAALYPAFAQIVPVLAAVGPTAGSMSGPSSESEQTMQGPSVSFLTALLNPLVSDAIRSDDLSRKLCAVEAASEIAAAAKNGEKYGFLAFLILLHSLECKELEVKAVAVAKMKEVARRVHPRSANSSEAVKLFTAPYYKDFIEFMGLRIQKGLEAVQVYAEELRGISQSEFAREATPWLLPWCLQRIAAAPDSSQWPPEDPSTAEEAGEQSQMAHALLVELASLHQMELPIFLLTSASSTLAAILIDQPTGVSTRVLEYLQQQIGLDLSDLLSPILNDIVQSLVWYLGDNSSDEARKRASRVGPVIRSLERIIAQSSRSKQPAALDVSRILLNLDHNRLRSKSGEDSVRAMRCLGPLSQIIANQLPPFAPKFLALLAAGLEKPRLREAAVTSSRMFTEQLGSVSVSSLKLFACQIVVAILPCLELSETSTESTQEGPTRKRTREEELADVVLLSQMPAQRPHRNIEAAEKEMLPHLEAACRILEFLIVQQREALWELFKDMPPLPNLHVLRDINRILQQEKGETGLRDHLETGIRGIKHHSVHVRINSAKQLKMVVEGQLDDFLSLVTSDVQADRELVSQLLTQLLKGCSAEVGGIPGAILKLTCAECLGVLGAIDPGRLCEVEQVELPGSIIQEEEHLVQVLINDYLATAIRSLTSADAHDAAAYAIQELLKLSGCGQEVLTSGSASRRGRALWASLSEEVKQLITPYVSSGFTISRTAAAGGEGPLYTLGLTCPQWLYRWLKRLMCHAQASLQALVYACSGIVKHDFATARFFLPLLVLNILRFGKASARDAIQEEVRAVLDAPADPSALAEGKHQVVVQEVFLLFDNVTRWLNEANQVVYAIKQARSNRRAPSASLLESEMAVSLCFSGDGWSDTHVLEAAEMQCIHVQSFLNSVPSATMTTAACLCRAHARALRYLEDSIREHSGSFNPASSQTWRGLQEQDLPVLLKVYLSLGEDDGVLGAGALRQQSNPPTLQEQILAHEASGSWSEALACYEQAIQSDQQSHDLQLGFLGCLLKGGHLQTMLTQADGLIKRLPEWDNDWKVMGSEAAWRLGHWEQLEEFLQLRVSQEEATDAEDGIKSSRRESRELALVMQHRLGGTAFAVHKGAPQGLQEAISGARNRAMMPLEAAAMESYTRAYPCLVQLHALRVLEEWGAIAQEDSTPDALQVDQPGQRAALAPLLTKWQKKLHLTEPAPPVREVLLATQRMVLMEAGASQEVGICWLQYAKVCRKAGSHEVASRAILQAKVMGNRLAAIEQAKLHWAADSPYLAVTCLQEVLLVSPGHFLGSDEVRGAIWGSAVPAASAHVMRTSPEISAQEEAERVGKSLLLLARWSHATGQKPKAQLLPLFGQVKALRPKWEKCFFFLARYLDDLMQDARKRQEETGSFGQGTNQSSSRSKNFSNSSSANGLLEDDKAWWTYVADTMQNYAQGLRWGHRHLFEALPRLLTLWFDFGSRFSGDVLKKGSSQLKAENNKVQKVIQECKKELPVYVWLTALPQLVSRICHSNPEVRSTLKGLLAHNLGLHPQQALWYLAAVSRSTVSARKDAAAEIQTAAKNAAGRKSERKAVFSQFNSFIDQMIRLSFHGSGTNSRVKSLSVSAEFGALKRMMPLQVLVPSKRALTVSLPASGPVKTDHEPFPPAEAITIAGIEDTVDVLQSLQKPKKIELIGSDGKKYPFLCKPKDDLRKDARMMEFTAVLNRIFLRHEASRTRKLYLRTFGVLPLTEDCGMVEWVPYTRGFRHILQDLYSACGRFDRVKTLANIRRIYDESATQGCLPAPILRDKVLPMFPPIFHRWFLQRFAEPAAWIQGRKAFVNTSAVWSMVGHIVGLGDRHGENVLLDSVSGDCVHVDFSCLFDKGLTLNQPEVVPFRLTQNMVDGLGVCGYEGAFRRGCEVTLTVLRSQRGALMSVLETFLYDPLVEWAKSSRTSTSSSPSPSANSAEASHPAAQKALSSIDSRLQGVVVGVGAAPSLPLSVEGQANHLILEATSIENLGKMYIWWMPWF